MKIILRESHENLGRTGDEVEVKPGYARNFLVPKGIAYPANRFYRRLFEVERAALERKDNDARSKAEGVAEKGHGITVEFTKRFGKLGKMFGSVTSSDIAEALKEQGVEINRRKIYLPEPIRKPGEHTVVCKPHGDVRFEVTVVVIPDQVEQHLEALSIQQLVNGEDGLETEETVEEGTEEAAAEVVEGEEVPAEEAPAEEAPEAPAEEKEEEEKNAE